MRRWVVSTTDGLLHVVEASAVSLVAGWVQAVRGADSDEVVAQFKTSEVNWWREQR